MIIGIEFNRTKTEEGKTFYRVAPYIHNVDKMKVGVTAFIILAAVFLFGWASFMEAKPQNNSHIKSWSSYHAN